MKKKVIIITTILLNVIFSQEKMQTNLFGTDLLNENPIYPIPEEMTFEEYQDMNRRLGVGLLLAAIPIPGTIHNYAGEEKLAKKYVGLQQEAYSQLLWEQFQPRKGIGKNLHTKFLF